MWYENLGGAIFDAAQVISTSFYGAAIFASDLDGDQRPDIICGDNHIAWYPNQTSIWGLEIQETPSHDLNFSFSHGHPNTDYYAFYTLNTLNASSPNTGAFFGLHINMYTVWDQLSLAYSGNPIFGGVLDVSGAATAVYDQVGLGALSGLTVWAVTVQEVPSQPGVFEASPITDFTFL
jgi:hypothetical protein